MAISGKEIGDLLGVSISNIFRMTLINPTYYLEPADKQGNRAFNFQKTLESVLTSNAWEAAAQLGMQKIGARGSSVTDSAFSSALQGLISSAVSDIAKKENVKFIKFYLNPNALDVSHQKITSEVYSGEGKILEIADNDLSTYTFNGSSGTLLPDRVFLSLGIKHPRLSRTWMKFMALEQFYLAHRDENLLILFEQKCYLGKVTRFHYRHDANNPWQILYDFTVRTDPTLAFNILTGGGMTNMFQFLDLNSIFTLRGIDTIQDKIADFTPSFDVNTILPRLPDVKKVYRENLG